MLQEIFNTNRDKANTKAKKFKCKASEGLGLYPTLAHFIQAVVLPAKACVKECVAFLAMADLLDVLQAVPLHIITPQQLKAVIHTLLQSCVAAGWRGVHASQISLVGAFPSAPKQVWDAANLFCA